MANPQGNRLPAAAVHAYDEAAGEYETDNSYVGRIDADLRHSVALMQRHLGTAPDVMVWPYGAHNALARRAAAAAGMAMSLSLDDLPNAVGATTINRLLINADTDLASLAATVQEAFGERPRRPQPLRAAQVDLDDIYHADPHQLGENLDTLLDRIKDMQINAVFLQAYADADGDGAAEALYFPNRHLPVRADLFSRVAWQLYTRTEVAVFAGMPVAAFDVSAADRKHILEIYDDLGRSGRFQGVLYRDDVRAPMGSDSIAFTDELNAVLRQWQPGLLTARNLHVLEPAQPDQTPPFDQTYRAFLTHYDYTAVVTDPQTQWLERLVATARVQHSAALQRTVFHLRTPRTDRPCSRLEPPAARQLRSAAAAWGFEHCLLSG